MDISAWFSGLLSPASVKHRQSDMPSAMALHREFANHPSRGLTPSKLASILQQAESGILQAQAELFMDMEEKDAHLAAELSKRKMAVKKLDWSLMPPADASAKEKRDTQQLEAVMRDALDIGALRMSMLDALGHGYSCIELGWAKNGRGLWLPNQVEHRSPTWFVCPQDNRHELRLRDASDLNGVPLLPFGWVVHVHQSRSGYLPRAGLHRVLVWPYLFKNYSVRDLAEFLEVYGLPIRVGKYPSSAGDKEKRDLLRQVLSIGHHAAGIIPDTMQLELQKVTASGNADAFKTMIDWAEASMSKAILGGTLTSSTAANGNRSLGDVHNEVRLDIRDDDAVQLDHTLSRQLVYPIAMLNFGFEADRCPKFVSDTQEPDDLQLLADALPKLANVGAQIPVSYVNAKLKIPLPENGEPILQASSSAVVDPNAGSAAAMAALSVPVVADVDSSPVSAMSNLLASAAGPLLGDWIAVLKAKVDAADSFEALQADLLASFGDLESGELTKVMGLAFAAADLSGRYDVAVESKLLEP